MPPRFFIDEPLTTIARATDGFALPSGPARHAQVLRLQPGDALTLFDGQGGEWDAEIMSIGRNKVEVCLGTHHHAVDRELGLRVTLALGMPANERMDALVEKATELGVAAIQPLVCERSVLRLAGERAMKKVAHWQGIAVAACEQSGRTRVPAIAPIRSLGDWLATLVAASADERRVVMSLREGQAALTLPTIGAVVCLSGPEGGLSEAEERAACGAAFEALSLGPRVLRADTAPVALLAHLALMATR